MPCRDHRCGWTKEDCDCEDAIRSSLAALHLLLSSSSFPFMFSILSSVVPYYCSRYLFSSILFSSNVSSFSNVLLALPFPFPFNHTEFTNAPSTYTHPHQY